MRDRAAWHFGGGDQYCKRCAIVGAPCAEGKPGIDGKMCPYHEHEPKTEAGAQAWDIMERSAGQFRYLLVGSKAIVTGLDMVGALALAEALCYNTEAVADLLPACEAGAIAGFSEANN